MYPTPQTFLKPVKSDLEDYIDDILVRSRAASDELDLLIALFSKDTVEPPKQFDKPNLPFSSPSLYTPESPRQDISVHSYQYEESSIPVSPASSRYSFFALPPSSTCDRRPANLRAHRILNTVPIEADDEGGESFISALPPRRTNFQHSFVELTESIENLPHFQYVGKNEVNISRSEEEEPISRSDPEEGVTISRSEETTGEGAAWKRERLLLEIMRNYGEEFS